MDVFRSDRIRNVVLLGHGGAGKTSLVEAMAYLSGITNRLGKVTDGNTVSDYDKEEIKRKFSISTSVVPIQWGKVKINVLDTPGYFDFVGEVEEAVAAADAAIIVVSGKSGVQVGTQKAWEMCEKYNLPRMFFVTEMDVDNVSYRKVVESLTELYGKKIAPIHMPYINTSKMTPVMRAFADEIKQPVCIMLDHAYTQEAIDCAIDSGMNAVMYDISTFPFDEHVKMMIDMVNYCKGRNVEVEGELGYLAREQKSWDAKTERATKLRYVEGSKETTPEEAKEYAEKTGVAALAVSIGNAHGQYTKAAKLNLPLLEEIDKVSPVPLVLHGSSGIPDDDLKKSIERGICKVNYYTGISQAAVAKIRQHLADNPDWKDYHPLNDIVKKEMKRCIQEKMYALSSNDKG